MDGNGTTCIDARAISNGLRVNGCVTNLAGIPSITEPLEAINQNGVFDAARRMSQWVRILPPECLHRYAVIGGKSVIWFRRRHPQTTNDWFQGIADAIAHTAPAGGWTNEWLVGAQWKTYGSSDSSLFKEDAYGRYFPVMDRCGFYAPELTFFGNKPLLYHVAYGQSATGGNMLAEMPTGYRYMPLEMAYSGRRTLNGGADQDFHRSCRIYEPDWEIESAVSETEGPLDLVKVTLTTRLPNTVGETGGVPAGDISSDFTTWSGGTIASEPYRTAENAIRLWILKRHTDYNPPPTSGDQAFHSNIHGLFDGVWASVLPHFYLVKLLPIPYVDDNDTQDETDTPIWHDFYSQSELYIRAMCEGFVDGEQSGLEMCDYWQANGYLPESWGLHDFNFESLCFQAFGQNSFGVMPASVTTETNQNQVRADYPHGFGHLQQIAATAEMHNRFASAVNLLTRVRLMLPYQIETRKVTYIGSKEVTLPMSCNIPGNTKAGIDGVDAPASDTYYSTVDWAAAAAVEANASSAFDHACPFSISSARDYVDYRVALEIGMEEAMAPIARELWDGGAASFVGVFTRTSNGSVRVETTAGDSVNVCAGVSDIIYYDSKYWRWNDVGHGGSVECQVVSGYGTLTPADLPAADYGLASVGSDEPCSFGGAQTSVRLDFAPADSLSIDVPLA